MGLVKDEGTYLRRPECRCKFRFRFESGARGQPQRPTEPVSARPTCKIQGGEEAEARIIPHPEFADNRAVEPVNTADAARWF